MFFAATGAPLQVFTLDDPPRVLVDLAAPWPGPGDREPGGLVAGVRHGMARPGVARLILDLAAPAAVDVEARADGFILRLEPVPAATFAASAGWPEGARADRLQTPPPLVVVDPGHGGRDPGAVVGGLREKDITLDAALNLAPRLEAAGFRVSLTRTDDRFVSLADRVLYARRNGAMALLSLHADTVATGDASGASVYLLAAGASDAQTAGLAEAANATDHAAPGWVAGEGSDVAAMLAALASRETQQHARALGLSLMGALTGTVPVLGGNPLRSAAFRVLKAPDVPSALVELGFLSNAEDRRRLADPAWQQLALSALTRGLVDWYATVRG
jgi:N-acetylmuramoyl-L-alanine amidase